MSGLPISSEYVDKGFLFALLFGFITVLSIGGCNDGSGGSDDQALTENDFAEDSALSADLEEGVVVTLLEAPNTGVPENDTGEVGIDLIPITYPQTTEQTFCWEDDNGEAAHFMELKDSRGNEVLRVDVNGDCVTRVIEAGNYVMSIHHDGSNEDSLAIFLRPNPQASEQTRETDGLINSLKSVALNISKGIENTLIQDAEAQRNMTNNIDLLISTNICRSCDLTGANLSHSNLVSAKLEGAKLIGADLSGADLASANLAAAKLRRADLTSADLSGANLTGADLFDTIFNNATWCNGCMCAEQSTGECVRCPPYYEVCRGS